MASHNSKRKWKFYAYLALFVVIGAVGFLAVAAYWSATTPPPAQTTTEYPISTTEAGIQ